jgi:hypothetical protein
LGKALQALFAFHELTSLTATVESILSEANSV